MMWFTQGLVLWLALAGVFTFGWISAYLFTDRERIAPSPSEPVLDEQDVAVLLSLCEQAMEDEPYTNRAVFLSALMDRLEDWQLAQ